MSSKPAANNYFFAIISSREIIFAVENRIRATKSVAKIPKNTGPELPLPIEDTPMKIKNTLAADAKNPMPLRN